MSKCAIGTSEETKSSTQDQDESESIVKTDSVSSNEQPVISQVNEKSLRSRESIGSVEKEPFVSSGITHSFSSVLGDGQNMENIEESFKAVFNASNELNMVYAARYKEWIIGYIEEWDDITSTRQVQVPSISIFFSSCYSFQHIFIILYLHQSRIEGRLIQFRQMRQKYAHYTGKVQGLHVKVDKKKEKRAAGAKSRLESKLDRNRIKLSGAEEVHNDVGKSLVALIEEVTVNYWKDVVPLLHMTIQFKINHSSDLAAVMQKLKRTDATLKEVSEQHAISETGRLDYLKPEPIPESVNLDCVPEEEERDEKDSSVAESEGLASV